ncbi:aminoglycoside 6'-N-acetyltransferase [Kaistia soli DSM 19436]|uniref:Aminoglycoside 6'-N-acetyltransferase n=1 Tax=Kaistia soli DSM 19436 TaxID=1122133 RepID=A0A1M5CXN4_9HYPH|nr:GNAT family N-acetyltransferase [Kaistia soli]SHF59431.1 aminoglycoside 6'-N-acetyltransferase [Kaistia soli DSM 19436]
MPPDASQRYGFRPLEHCDLGRIRAWLSAPHVAAWWDEADFATEKIAAHLSDPAVRSYLILIDGREAGYLQSYDPHAEADHPYQDQPNGTLGIDQFIGEANLIGVGHGPALIATFALQRFAEGVPRIITDPDPANQRAVRAYAKAGFRVLDQRTTIYGPALIMGRDSGNQTRPT